MFNLLGLVAQERDNKFHHLKQVDILNSNVHTRDEKGVRCRVEGFGHEDFDADSFCPVLHGYSRL
jgi:hypothetical protein